MPKQWFAYQSVVSPSRPSPRACGPRLCQPGALSVGLVKPCPKPQALIHNYNIARRWWQYFPNICVSVRPYGFTRTMNMVLLIHWHRMSMCATKAQYEPWFTMLQESRKMCSSWKLQHTFNTYVGGKLLGPTFLGSPTLRTVGVGVTFSLLSWKFCWTYRFWLPNSKNCWPFRTVVETFDSFVGATFLTFVGPTVLGPYYCWGDFSPFVGPTIFVSQQKSPQRKEGPKTVGPTKVRKVATTKESKVSTTVLKGQQFLLLGSQNL